MIKSILTKVSTLTLIAGLTVSSIFVLPVSADAGLDIVENAQSTESLSTLVDAVVAANLVETLQGEGPFTVFAPTNDAFAAVDPLTLEVLLCNPEKLAEVLTYHVVAGNIMSGDITNSTLTTVNGADVELNIDDGIKINGSNITIADVEASNGVVHIIDQVLLPEGFNLSGFTCDSESNMTALPDTGISELATSSVTLSLLIAFAGTTLIVKLYKSV